MAGGRGAGQLALNDEAGRVARRHHMTLSSRRFLGVNGVGVFEGIEAPPLERLRSVARQLHRLEPDHPLFLRPIGWPGPGWERVGSRQLDAFCEQLVVEGPARGDGSIAAMAERLLNTPLPHTGFQMLRGEGRIAAVMDHAMGDGRSLTWLLASLVQAARYDNAAILLRPRGVRAPLFRALAHYYGRDPRRVLATLREPRPAPAALSRHATPRPEGEVAVAAASMSVAATDELRRWRAARCPGALTSTLLGAAVARALADEGVGLSGGGMSFLVDARRYLPSGTTVHGVFVTAAFVRPDDPTDPVALSDALQSALASGRPLASLALETAKAFVSRGAPPGTEIAPSQAVARLSISHLQRPPLYEQLPWIGGYDAGSYLGAAPPDGVIGLSFVLCQLGHRMHLSAMFRPPALSRATVERVMARVADEPIALLEEAR